MSKIIAFANQKGGVGKTTTVQNIGAVLSDLGNKVLLIDLDPQASLTILSLNSDVISNLETTLTEILLHGYNANQAVVKINDNLDIIPCNTDLANIEKMMSSTDEPPTFLRESIEDLKGYDYILIDCPPQLSQLTLNGLTAADEVIIPTQAEYLAIKGLEQLKKTIQLVVDNSNAGLSYRGVVITKFRANTIHTQEIKEFLNQSETLIGTIRESIKVSDSIYEEKPIVWSSPKHPSSIAYKAIAKKIDGVELSEAEERELND